MSEYLIHKKKRFILSAAVLLTGVVFTGAVAGVIGTPKGQSAYLHEHLSGFAASDLSVWEESEFDLPPQDKSKIETIIRMGEVGMWETGMWETGMGEIGMGETGLGADRLQDYLTGQALEMARSHSTDCARGAEFCSQNIRVKRKLVAQQVNKDFRVANIKETSVRVNFKTETDTGALTFQGLSHETRILRFYQTQGGWVQNSSEVTETAAPVIHGRSDTFKARFSRGITGLNYYPAAASWKDFWIDFPLADINSDLEIAQELNVNSLRIFLNHEYFSAPETQEDGLEKLQIFLDMCQEKNISVLVTLFDLRPNYALANWDADIDHIDTVLSKVSGHDAILGIDLKNQPDLDFENWGEGRVEGWLTVMARHIQTSFPELAVTAGWSRAENAARLANVFDVVTYHEYQNPKGFSERLKSVSTAADGKPVMITELGATTWKPPFINRIGEKAQASRLSSQLGQAGGASGVFIWTLHDFEKVGTEIVGPLPWRRAQQKHYGLLRVDGSERPAAEVLRRYGARNTSVHANPNRTLHITKPNN